MGDVGAHAGRYTGQFGLQLLPIRQSVQAKFRLRIIRSSWMEM